MESEKAELIRRKYRYRRMVMTGEIRLPPRVAGGLIGPDCAYHLYAVMGAGEAAEGKFAGSPESQPSRKCP